MSSSNTPRRSPVQEALDAVEVLCDYAYEQGFHEMGYDPVEVLRNALRSEIGKNAAPQSEGTCDTGLSPSYARDGRADAAISHDRPAEVAALPSAVAAPDIGHVLAARKLWRTFRELEQDCHGDAQEAFIRIVAPILARTESAIGAQWIPTSEGIPVIEGQWLIVRWNERVSPRYECVEYTEDCIDWDMTTHWMVMQNPTDSGSEDK